MDHHAAAIEAHYEANWRSPSKRLRQTEGPVDDLPDCFEVLAIQRPDRIWAYATKCMSTPEDEHGLELHLLTRSRFAWETELVETLAFVAHYHRTGRRLGLHHSVNIGRPIVPRSRCTHAYLSLPYLDGPSLEWMGKTRFLWLVPITQEELDLKKKNGVEALESKFEEVQFDYADFFRQSVV